ncbi:MAG: hypothetical protein HRU05_00520 [Oceanospirillaceae bacterium]|nr:hypothetical protein [Oceanospirillaceae bacterium]
MKANKWGSPEIQNLIQQLPIDEQAHVEAKSNIPEGNKECYTIVGYTRKSQAGTNQIAHKVAVFTKTITDYDSMIRRWNGGAKEYNEYIILHDPKLTVPIAPKNKSDEQPKPLTVEQQQEIAIMQANDSSLKEISQALGLTQKRIKPYLT